MPRSASSRRRGRGSGHRTARPAAPLREAARADLDGDQRGDGAGGHPGPVDGAVDHRLEGLADPAPHLDADGADQALGVGLAEHREGGGEPVATGGGHAGGGPQHAGKGGGQEEGVGHRGPVAVLAGHRVGEPGQLATRAALAVHPGAVAPVEGQAPQTSVVGPGAGRPAGAGPGHVDLVDLVEQAGGVGGEEVGQPGGEPGTHGHGATPHPGLVVEGEQRPGRAQLVAARHDRSSGLEGPLGLVGVVLARTGQHHDGVAGLVDVGGA